VASPERFLLKGPMPELRTQTKEELKLECEMWRNIWSWVPHEVRYYVARTGQIVGLTQRNYHRYLGKLLDTHWILDEIELGVEDKIYDTTSGEYFFERKIVRMKIGGIIDVQWIKERQTEEEFLGVKSPPPEEPTERIDVTKEEMQDRLEP